MDLTPSPRKVECRPLRSKARVALLLASCLSLPGIGASQTIKFRSIGTAADYTTGTITATNGSAVVIGSGTLWKTANRGRGDRVHIGSTDYVIRSVDSETKLTLTTTATAGYSGTYTISRQFSTLAAWEDCINGPPGTACPFFPVSSSSLVADNRFEIGIAYNDSVFTLTSDVIIDGATTDATHRIVLTVDPGNRHNGTPGAGVRIDANGNANEVQILDDNVTFEWFEIYNFRNGSTEAEVRVIGPAANNVLLQNLLLHDFAVSGTNDGIRLSGSAGKSVTVRNTMIWDGDHGGIVGDEVTDTLIVENCSVDWIHGSPGNGVWDQNTPTVVRNTIATNNAGSDFNQAGGGLSGSNNTSSDTSATSLFTNPQQAAGSALFVSSGVAAANLHLKAGAPAIDTGLDLSASFWNDVDGQSRLGLSWDRGADELGAPTAVTLRSFDAEAMDGAVALSWRTSSELNNLGFQLYRATEAEGPYEPITSAVIPGLGSSVVGADYRYLDSGLANGTTYFYQLEDIDTTGATKRHGPVSTTPLAGARVPIADAPPVEVGYGDPTPKGLRVVERDSRHLVLELETPGFTAAPGTDGSVQLSIPAFSEESEPSTPAIPVLRSWVEVSPGFGARITSVRSEDVELFSSLRPSAAGAPELLATRRGTVFPGRRARPEGASFRGAGLYPEAEARLLELGYQGETKKALVELAPLRWNRTTGNLVFARRLVVEIAFEGRDARPRRRRSDEKRSVVRRLLTRDRGLHAVTFEDLFGRRERSVRTETLRLSRLGQAVAIHVEPNTPEFGPGSTLFFMSDGASLNPYGDEAAYELELNGGDGGGVRMPVVSVPPSGTGLSLGWQQEDREEQRYYQAGLVEAQDPWLWDLLFAPVTKSYSFEVTALASTPDPARISVWLQGVSDVGGADHHLRLSVNGTFVAESTFDGKQPLEMTAEIPAGALHEGSNALEIENVGDTGASYSMVMLDRFSVTYPRKLVAVDGIFEGRFRQSGTVEIQGMPEGSVVLDATDPTPRWLGTPTRFHAEAGRHYRVQSPRALLKPVLRTVPPTDLKSPRHQADYLVIGPKDLLGIVQPLLELRQSQGLRSRAVAVEEIYSAFGFGESRPEALHEFLSYAYHEWKKPSPRYVLLLGDGTYDFKDYLQTGVENQVPPWIVKTSYLWTASDSAYAAVNGEDILPDIALGRLPAASADEARAMVEKILAFESSGALTRGPFVLVADDADEAGDFEAQAEELAGTVLSGRDTRKLYLGELGVEATRSAVLRSFDDGAGLWSYLGHGGIDVWAQEDIFDTAQVGRLAPQSQTPVLLTMNCLNGYFDFPYFDSLAENLLKAEGKGAVAAFSPSGLSLDEPAHLYHRLLLRALLSGENRRLGDAVLQAQSAYADSGAFPELLRIYLLLGDPALTLR